MKLRTNGNEAHGGLLRLGGNALSLMASESVNRLGTFAVYALVAREFGTEDFGRLSLGITIMQALQLVATAGLLTVVSRTVARDAATTSENLVNGVAIVSITGCVAILGLVATLPLLGYDADTRAVVLLMTVAVIPYGIGAVADGVLQGLERMHLIALANVASNVVKVGLAALLLLRSVPILPIVAVLILAHVVASMFKILAIGRQPEFQFERPRVASIRVLLAAMRTFFAMRVIQAILSSVDVIAISIVAGAASVALVASALQLLTPVGLLFESATLASFPLMCRYSDAPERLRRFSGSLLELLLLVVAPGAVLTAHFADSILTSIYGNEGFADAADLLSILVWVLVLRTSTHVLGMNLLATDRERTTLRILIGTGLIALAVSPTLVAFFGVTGAALSVTLVRSFSLVQHIYATRSAMGARFMLQVSWIPATSAAAMWLILRFSASLPATGTVLLGATAYVVAAATLELMVGSGIDGVRVRLLEPLRDLTRTTELDGVAP